MHHELVSRKNYFPHQLIAVTDVYSFETGIDGAAVYSKICEEEHPVLFIRSAKIRSEDVLNRCVEIIHQ